jgi:hypothetical protein
MKTTPLPTRAQLVDSLPAGSLVIELGVAAGAFAEEMLTRNPGIRYLGIDRWSDHHNIAEMLQAADRVRPFQTPHFITGTFARAVAGIDDASAALIYIDGYAHTGQERGQTLRDWWPKLKPGGIFAGHDYDAHEYPQTVEAVDDFVREHRLDLQLTGETSLPSWWMIKP